MNGHSNQRKVEQKRILVILLIFFLLFFINCSTNKQIKEDSDLNLQEYSESSFNEMEKSGRDSTIRTNLEKEEKVIRSNIMHNLSYSQYYIGEAEGTIVDENSKNQIRKKALAELARAIYVEIKTSIKDYLEERVQDQNVFIIEKTTSQTKMKSMMAFLGEDVETKEELEGNKFKVIKALRKEALKERIQKEFSALKVRGVTPDQRFMELRLALDRLNKYPVSLFNIEQDSIYHSYLVEYLRIVSGIKIDDNGWKDLPWEGINIERKKILRIRTIYNGIPISNIQLLIKETGDTVITRGEEYSEINLKKCVVGQWLKLTIVPLLESYSYKINRVLYEIDEDNLPYFKTLIGCKNIDFSDAHTISQSEQVYLNALVRNVLGNLPDCEILDIRLGQELKYDWIFNCKLIEAGKSGSYHNEVYLTDPRTKINKFHFLDSDITKDEKDLKTAFKNSMLRWLGRYQYYDIKGIIEEPNDLMVYLQTFGKKEYKGKYTDEFFCKGVLRNISPTIIFKKKGYRTLKVTLPKYSDDYNIFNYKNPIRLEKSHGYFRINASGKGKEVLVNFTVKKLFFPYLTAFSKEFIKLKEPTTTIYKKCPPGRYLVKAESPVYIPQKIKFKVKDSDYIEMIDINMTEKPLISGFWRNAVIPGWGQYYFDQPKWKALVHFSFTLGLSLYSGYTYLYEYLPSRRDFIKYRDKYNSMKEGDFEYYSKRSLETKKKMISNYRKSQAMMTLSFTLYLYNFIDLYLFKDKYKLRK